MKRFFIVVVAILLGCSVVSAQQKGDKYFGGMTGIAIQAGDGVGAGFIIQPEFGGFVADKCKLGISAGYAISGGIHTFTLTPNFSYYVRLCDNVYYTPGIEAGFAMAAAEGAVAAGVGVGLQLFSMEFRPTKHFGFTANLISLNFVGMEGAAAINFDLGVNPTVGLRYYF
jgi:hypothetical protein